MPKHCTGLRESVPLASLLTEPPSGVRRVPVWVVNYMITLSNCDSIPMRDILMRPGSFPLEQTSIPKLTLLGVFILPEANYTYACVWPAILNFLMWFRGSSVCLQCGRPGFEPWVGKIPWRRMATHSSILAWRIPWTEELGRLQSTGSQSWTQLSDFTFTFSHVVGRHFTVCFRLILI